MESLYGVYHMAYIVGHMRYRYIKILYISMYRYTDVYEIFSKSVASDICDVLPSTLGSVLVFSGRPEGSCCIIPFS